MADINERIQACIVAELLAADIYRQMASRFPDDSAFFTELAAEEERHADLLTLCKGLKKRNEVPKYVPPDSLAELQRTIEFATGLKKRLDSGDVSMKEALGEALKLEHSAAEEHFHSFFDGDTESVILEKLKRLQVESGHHAAKIKSFMKRRNLLD